MSSKRLALMGLGVAVVAGLVALLVAARGGSSSTPRSAARGPSESRAADRAAEGPGAAARPRPEVEEPPAIEDTDAGPRVYVRDDGKVVRDHRTGNPEPMMTGGVPVPEKMRKVQAQVIYEVRKLVRPMVYECAESLSADGFGEDPMVQGEIMITIENGAVSVDQVDVKFRDVDGDTESVADCVRGKVGEVSFSAAGHEDVSRYWLTMPFKLRR